MTGVVPLDTTGLPPGGVRGPHSDGSTEDGATIFPGATASDSAIDTQIGPQNRGPRVAPKAFIAGTTVGGRYHVIRLLGIGGMGAVYQAWDEKLEVAVALKVILQPARNDDPAAAEAAERRFKRELLLARQVTHKNVVRIHDLGEVDGIPYITMPYIHGANLAAILARGRMPVPRVVHLAVQVASGLAAAHEAGVVHRDLKPANIMIEEESDRALIMDFGIARSTAAESGRATKTGGIVGTLEYMAPEQAEGKPVDHRCDIYAFGLIVYDMLCGGRPAGNTPVSDLMARLQKPLPGIRTLNPDVPAPLAAIVDRCLERDPAARYQTTAELAAALDGLDESGQLKPTAAPPRSSRITMVAAVAVLILAIAVGLVVRRRGTTTAPPPHEPVSVLIADFDNRANDPVFDGSIEQALTIGVEGASFITAYQREAARRLAAQLAAGKLDPPTARLIAVRDGVKFVIGGAITAEGGAYSISADLIDPAVGKTIKTTTTRAKTKSDVLAAVGQLAASVRRDLGDVTPESARTAASETFTAASLEAVREYTVAQNLANNSKDEDAIVHYKAAIAADKNFGRAYSGWAVSAFQLGRSAEAEEQWKKALALMDRMTERERYRTLGSYYIGVARNYEQAVDNFGKLVKLYPADRAGHNNLALAYFYLLNFDKATEEQRKAVAIYKGSFKFRNNLVLYSMYAGDFDGAATGARQLIDEDPKFSDAYFPLATSLLVKGDRAAARDAYERMAKIPVGASRAAMGLADVAMYEGRFADAIQILTTALPEDEKDRTTQGAATKLVALAESHIALGQQAAAIDAARKAASVLRWESVLVPAGRVLAAAGRTGEAKAFAAELARALQPQTRAYGRIIEGEIALQDEHPADAVEAFRAAQRLFDSWLAHFDLGIAYIRAGHYAEALAELDTCRKRQGEATALFLDDMPTFRYLAPLTYWLGRAQDGVGMKGPAAENYKAYMATRPDAGQDALAEDAKRRLAQQ